ncbi:hypothetical protein D9756_005920 [Leucocoprinus leucothites]|uniref:Xylanolytic transcriptional activator regulatory domain-containing protein n=1 Tax=Leucocoprinus leucothites TaxID=201217 RepID=A0A8H5D496_9AGAR|nr:hypothetical protein D9756_005920 [Leucoagaricus leucothites]
MDWRDSEVSDDETGQDHHATSRKRSSRGSYTSQFLMYWSLMHRTLQHAISVEKLRVNFVRRRLGLTWLLCAILACTFLGPSYKRGPPKGYIHAIEQRWHQVESLLGAILQCPDARVQEFVNDLKQDDLAREIIDRVDLGPYGPAGRRSQPPGATKEDIFASILRNHGLSVVPTKEWQDNLSRRLAGSLAGPSRGSLSPTSSYSSFRSSSSSSVPATQKRRLNDPVEQSYPRIGTKIDSDDAKDATESMGVLSLDENQEIRYHGRISGLSLLGRNTRTDDRIEGGIWRLPMARVWPPARYGLASPPLGEMDVRLPSWDVQDRLIEVYFTYIHPVFPVIHRSRFLAEYHYKKHGARRQSPKNHQQSPRPEPTQEVTSLLLLAIFAIAARFCDDEMPLPPTGKMWEAGCQYLDLARGLLAKVFHVSRPSTVQALLLLGYREFGIGSMEQGWIFIGMAIRMAFDLGLNCDSSKWTAHGHELFSPEETQTRRQIWWASVLADRYGSLYMGRPTMIKDSDSDVPLPHVDPEEDAALWQPLPSDGIPYTPAPGRIMSSFAALSRLSIIAGTIINKVYPVQGITRAAKQTIMAECEAQLDQWFLSLPDHLHCDSNSRRGPSLPQVIFLHVRYWGCVLLLYRAFIPNWKSGEEVARNSPIGSKALDLAQSAASHISSLVTAYRETLTLRRTSPFLTAYLLSASIMHILTLSLRSSHVEAALGLQQCMSALKDMEIVWPSASRAWDLLNGVKLSDGIYATQLLQVQGQSSDRQKRLADDAFGQEKEVDYRQRGVYDDRGNISGNESSIENQNGVQDLSTRIMAHMLGLDIPGIEPSTSYYPGYQWWPRASGQEPSTQPVSQPISPPPIPGPTQLGSVTAGGVNGLNSNSLESWAYPPVTTNHIPESYSYDFSQFGP